MTFDECSDGLIRLAEAHGETLTEGKIAAYFQKLRHVHAHDWESAVINLQATRLFPRDWRDMLKEADVQRSDRHKLMVTQERQEADQFFTPPIQQKNEDSMDFICHQCAVNAMVYFQTKDPKLQEAVKGHLENFEFAQWAKRQPSRVNTEGSIYDTFMLFVETGNVIRA